ncbi:fluoride efflux transporter CrcB [Sphingorhabdus sp. Alg239-R122]|uniref:fluoride efflux transporter CrcB n=1 Tax=Sphingorhabdus sp. Alg239-R122 TaxID=2305989 RepID=UPI0013D9F503|nr:fluoride efflux transporter CrcB [Sphingorhabdus sp. Alg239-R122]
MINGLSLASTLLVMAGGACGAALRYHLGRLLFHAAGPGLPWGTFAVNIIGGFAMGALVGLLARSDVSGEPWRLFLGVGLLGGFTTFSAFSLEIFAFIERGEWGMAFAYALASVLGSVVALFAGIYLIRQMV